MNYRHIYHAGSFSDVFKHILLVSLVQSYLKKDKPFCYLETHAGLSSYDLQSKAAQKTREFQTGIAKFAESSRASSTNLLATYLEKVQDWNNTLLSKLAAGSEMQGAQERKTGAYIDVCEDLSTCATQQFAAAVEFKKLRYYSGSPRLVRYFLRANDRMVLTELHPRDILVLKQAFFKDPQVAVHHLDGYQSLKAFLPPKERRGLVFIDPPFEQDNEFTHIIQQLKVAVSRWSTGTYTVWYPIKERTAVNHFYQELIATGLKEILCCEFQVSSVGEEGLDACGMIVIQPPWQWEEEVRKSLSILSQILGGDFKVKWLAKG